MRPIAALLGSAVVLATLVVEAKAFVACSSGLLDLSIRAASRPAELSARRSRPLAALRMSKQENDFDERKVGLPSKGNTAFGRFMNDFYEKVPPRATLSRNRVAEKPPVFQVALMCIAPPLSTPTPTKACSSSGSS
jgi:hypothetical protein